MPARDKRKPVEPKNSTLVALRALLHIKTLTPLELEKAQKIAAIAIEQIVEIELYENA